MKVERTNAVALLVALGFNKAGDWDNEKLAARLAQVPAKVDESKVPDEFKDLYGKLGEAAASDNDAPIELTGEAPAKKSKPAAAPAKAPAAKKGSKPAAEAKPAKSRSRKEPKEIEDEFVGREGSKSANVRAHVTKAWQSDEEIQAKCGETLTNTRLRLYHAVKAGTVEVRKRIEYRRIAD
jgi:hypothetical protein